MVKQVNGQYKVKNAALKGLYQQVRQRVGTFAQVELRHVRRDKNAKADGLVNQALDMEADVADAVGTAEGLRRHKTGGRVSSQVGRAAGGRLLAAVDLNEKIEFSDSKRQRQLLGRKGLLLSGLLCLQPGQKYELEGKWQQATLTVMRGRGCVQVGTEQIAVKAGWWLHIEGAAGVVTADAGEQMIIILTAQE